MNYLEAYLIFGEAEPYIDYDPTEEELLICQLYSWGYTADKIAAIMNVSDRRIDNLLYAMRKHFKAKNTLHLVAILIRKKLIL